MLDNVGAWNGTGGFWKHRSRENIGVWKDVGRLWEMLECGIGKRWSMENVGKHWSVNGMEIWGGV